MAAEAEQCLRPAWQFIKALPQNIIVVECLPTMCEALDSLPNTEKQKACIYKF